MARPLKEVVKSVVHPKPVVLRDKPEKLLYVEPEKSTAAEKRAAAKQVDARIAQVMKARSQ